MPVHGRARDLHMCGRAWKLAYWRLSGGSAAINNIPKEIRNGLDSGTIEGFRRPK